jgi:hypothetical protein
MTVENKLGIASQKPVLPHILDSHSYHWDNSLPKYGAMYFGREVPALWSVLLMESLQSFDMLAVASRGRGVGGFKPPDIPKFW